MITSITVFALKLFEEKKADYIITCMGLMVLLNVECIESSVGLPFNTYLQIFFQVEKYISIPCHEIRTSFNDDNWQLLILQLKRIILQYMQIALLN